MNPARGGIVYQPVGIIRTPFKEASGTPIQPAGAEGVQGTVEVFPEFQEGLADLAGFSHIVLLYHCHRCQGFSLKVTPFMDETPRGVFATRAPARPNAIGLSIVRLTGISDNVLSVLDVDILDGTPLLDIKPHVEAFHVPGPQRLGWLENNILKMKTKRDDARFQP